MSGEAREQGQEPGARRRQGRGAQAPSRPVLPSPSSERSRARACEDSGRWQIGNPGAQGRWGEETGKQGIFLPGVLIFLGEIQKVRAKIGNGLPSQQEGWRLDLKKNFPAVRDWGGSGATAGRAQRHQSPGEPSASPSGCLCSGQGPGPAGRRGGSGPPLASGRVETTSSMRPSQPDRVLNAFKIKATSKP